ncbi:MAG: flippase [Elusimicrobia bacterium]|nr:flippase [Elusimicrobiota bacterium]
MKQKSLKLNFIMNVILTVFTIIFPLIIYPYISRILLPEGVGKVALAISIVSYFSMFAQLGIPIYGLRLVAQLRDDKKALIKAVQELFIINMITTFIAYITLILAVFCIPQLKEEKLLYIIMRSSLILNTIGMEWLFKGLEEYTYITIRSILFKAIGLILVFLLIHSKSDYIIYGTITIISGYLAFVLNFIYSFKWINFKPLQNYNFKQHIKPIFIFFAMACAITVYTNLDTVMLGFMKTNTDVGYYSVAIKIKNVLVGLVTTLGAILLPRCSYYIKQNLFDEFKKISSKAMSFIFIFSVPLLIYFIFFAKYTVLFLFGSEFMGSIIPMQVIMPTLLFIGITNLIGYQIMVPLGKENLFLYSVIAGAIIDIILNLLLIPKYSATGAALGTMFAELIVLIFQVVVMRKYVLNNMKNQEYIKIISAVFSAIIIALYLTKFGYNNLFAIIISALSFFVVYIIVLILTKEKVTIELFNQIVLKLKKVL